MNDNNYAELITPESITTTVVVFTVKGFYNGITIVSDDGIYSARAYASRDYEWMNKFGIFNLKKVEDFWFFIIIEGFLLEE